MEILVVLLIVLLGVIAVWVLGFLLMLVAIPFIALGGLIYTIREKRNHG